MALYFRLGFTSIDLLYRQQAGPGSNLGSPADRTGTSNLKHTTHAEAELTEQLQGVGRVGRVSPVPSGLEDAAQGTCMSECSLGRCQLEQKWLWAEGASEL